VFLNFELELQLLYYPSTICLYNCDDLYILINTIYTALYFSDLNINSEVFKELQDQILTQSDLRHSIIIRRDGKKMGSAIPLVLKMVA
jgi:hypothetical protein